MSAIVERLLNMLDPRGMDPVAHANNAGPGTNPERFDANDVRAALEAMDQHPRSALLLRHHRSDLVSRVELVDLRLLLIAEIRAAIGQRDKPGASRWTRSLDHQAGVVNAALVEFVDDRVCSLCKGTGEIKVMSKDDKVRGLVSQGCPTCSGCGTVQWTARARMRAGKIGKDSWYRGCEGPHDHASARLRILAAEGDRQLRRRMGILDEGPAANDDSTSPARARAV